MRLLRGLSKDFYGAALLVMLGVGAVQAGLGYGAGTLTEMGPGYMPVALGILCILLGLVLGITAERSQKPAGKPDLRGWVCILTGIFAFVVLGRYGGLAPAGSASVFIAALGDRRNSLREAFLLACLVVLAGVLIFRFGLHIQMPLFAWG
jgi:hypothetical protein